MLDWRSWWRRSWGDFSPLYRSQFKKDSDAVPGIHCYISTHVSHLFIFFNLQTAQLNDHHWLAAATKSLKWVQLAQVVTVWQSSLQKAADRFQRGSDWKSTISRRACLTSSRSMAHARQMSQMSPRWSSFSCCFCGLSRWPGQTFTAWTK